MSDAESSNGGSTNLIVISAILAAIIVIGLTMAIICISREPGGLRGWLRRRRERTRRDHQQSRTQASLQNTANFDHGAAGQAQADQPPGNQAQGGQAAVELRALRPAILTNGGPHTGGGSWPGTHIGWDDYHLTRRNELGHGRISVEGSAGGLVRRDPPDHGSVAGPSSPRTTGSALNASDVAVAPSHVWPGHGVGPGN